MPCVWHRVASINQNARGKVTFSQASEDELPPCPPCPVLTLSLMSLPQKGEKRLKGVSIPFPIVLGTVAVSLGKKATDNATHSWTVYARSPKEENLGAVVKKVTFKLHDSFTNPFRDVNAPPFELQEVGWGEFDLLVELHFHDDVQEPPLELLHSLRLGLDVHGNPQRRPYVHEIYHEIVFWEPTVELAERAKVAQSNPAPVSSVAQYFGRFDPEADYQLVQAGRKRLAKHYAMLKAKLATLELEGVPGLGAPTLDREASLFPSNQ